MSYFFAIISVPCLLCAVISQAAPMVTTPDGQTPPAPPAVLVKIPQPPQPVSVELRSQTQSTSEPFLTQCPAETQPGQCTLNPQEASCPTECPVPQSDTTSKSKKPKEKKTGWINGIKNTFFVCYNAFTNYMVGENGLLTNLRVDQTPKKKSPKKNSNKGNGPTYTCCICSKNGPPVKDDEQEEEDEDKKPTNDHVQPINCFWIKNKSQTSFPGAPAVTAPLVPGATANTKSTTFNCCFTGPVSINFKKFITIRAKPHFNVCACTVNASLVDA